MLLLVLLLIGCRFGEEPAFDVTGTWVADNFYCNNTDNCFSQAIDHSSILTFEIQANNDSNLVLGDGEYIKPSCQANPRCNEVAFIADSASFINESLYIVWNEYFVFIGDREGEVFKGRIEYRSPGISYLWNDNVTIKRK